MVVSPYARTHDVTNVVHDHTSVLATIERQWNLPALTYRDANAATLADFLDPSVMSLRRAPRAGRTGQSAAGAPPGLPRPTGAAVTGLDRPGQILSA